MINIPKIYRTLELSEYAPELEGQNLSVWVNPPRQKLIDLQEHAEDESFNFSWLASMWSTVDKEYSADEVKDFFEQCIDVDPGLWVFVSNRTVGLIAEHRALERKN